ncbi:lecithin retinol acyltransferase family protein [Microbulbifer litoralis]|uniref:lecithin retinol acyltransferase family protein n=1 Tax=Microbulbifer litoralis TaxID=2933965 RepID=UPI0020282B6E|nr:lecithin retinol acyltransferase family protein [Microbulbifer sp. GX H0434]
MIKVLKIDLGLYDHWALVSDRYQRGKPMLISNTLRNGTVVEEPWDDVVAGRPFKVIWMPTLESATSVISTARSLVGKVRYSLAYYNCEHFVREVATGMRESKQVKQVATALTLLGAFVYLAKK